MLFKTLGELEKMCGIQFDKAGPEGQAAPPRASGPLGALGSWTACAAALRQGASATQVHTLGELWVLWARGQRVGAGRPEPRGRAEPSPVLHPFSRCRSASTRLRVPQVGPGPPWVRSALPGALSALCVLGVQMAVTVRGCPCEFPSWRATFPGCGVYQRQNL